MACHREASSSTRLLVLMPGNEGPMFLACPARVGVSADRRTRQGEATASTDGAQRVDSRPGAWHAPGEMQPAADAAPWSWQEGQANASVEPEDQFRRGSSTELAPGATSEGWHEAELQTLPAVIRRRVTRACSQISHICMGKGMPTVDGWLTALQLAGMSHAFFC